MIEPVVQREDFDLVEEELPALKEGDIQIKLVKKNINKEREEKGQSEER